VLLYRVLGLDSLFSLPLFLSSFFHDRQKASLREKGKETHPRVMSVSLLDFNDKEEVSTGKYETTSSSLLTARKYLTFFLFRAVCCLSSILTLLVLLFCDSVSGPARLLFSLSKSRVCNDFSFLHKRSQQDTV
jgi:hypothetical protein